MKKLIIVLGITSLIACEKEEPQQTTQPAQCDCYQQGSLMIQGEWTPQYDSPSEQKPCEIDGEVTYESVGGNYWKKVWICQ